MVDGRIVSDAAVKETVLIVEFLRRCPLFAEQPPAMLAQFAEQMQRESFEPGETLIREGEVGDKFYIIESGRVEVSGKKDGVPFSGVTLSPGDFFGEVALLTGAPRNATVIALEPTDVFTLAKKHFDNALQQSKTLEEQLREVLYHRG
jgi:putative ABC transport system ATP-binding protein